MSTPSHSLLAEIPFNPLASAIMAGLGSFSHKWQDWLITERLNGDVEILVIFRPPPGVTHTDKTSLCGIQKRISSSDSPTRVLEEIFSGNSSSQILDPDLALPSWKDLPLSSQERAYAQSDGRLDFEKNLAIKVKSSRGYIAYEKVIVEKTTDKDPV